MIDWSVAIESYLELRSGAYYMGNIFLGGGARLLLLLAVASHRRRRRYGAYYMGNKPFGDTRPSGRQ